MYYVRFHRFCGYIVDSGDNQFQFHGFKCNPNADKLCLALHSACQARYQRVIDAHLTDGDEGNVESSTVRQYSYTIHVLLWLGTVQYVCLHVHVTVHIHVCVHVHNIICVCLHVHVTVHVHICVHICVHVCLCTMYMCRQYSTVCVQLYM